MSSGFIYRTPGAWGPGKGSNLTPAEVDQNFHHADQRLEELEDNPPTAVSISSIVAVGRNLTIYTTDGTEHGPFELPQAAFRYRGEWAASASYLEFDIFSYGFDGIYLVLQDHTAASTFDADADNTEGPLYQRVFGPIPGSTVETISSSTHTLQSTNSNRYLRCTNTSGCAVTIPTDATLNFDVGTEVHFRQAAAGGVTFTGAPGVTINGITGFDNATEVQGAVATVKKVASNTWDLFGLLAATS